MQTLTSSLCLFRSSAEGGSLWAFAHNRLKTPCQQGSISFLGYCMPRT